MEQTVRDFNSSGLVGESTACPVVVVLVPLCVHARGGTDETSEYGIPTWDDVRRTCVEVPVGCAMCVTYYDTFMSEGGGEGSNIFISCFVRRRRQSSLPRCLHLYDSYSKVSILVDRHKYDFEANISAVTRCASPRVVRARTRLLSCSESQ